MGSDLDNARKGLAHIRQAIVECHAGARLIDVDDGLPCLDDEAAVDELVMVEEAEESATRRLQILELVAVDWVKSCEARCLARGVPLTEGRSDGKQRSGDGQAQRG